MDTELIAFVTKAALCTVGTVQMLKNFTKKLNIPGFVYVIITILVGMAYSLLPLNDRVFRCVLVICGGTLFYDTILKAFEKIFSKGDTSSKELETLPIASDNEKSVQ